MAKKGKKKTPGPLMTLKVGPKRYDVLAATNISHNGVALMGQCDSQSGQILIDVEFFASSQRETLFHEAIHAVDHLFSLGLTEEQVGTLSVGMLSLIDDNPELLAFEGVE